VASETRRQVDAKAQLFLDNSQTRLSNAWLMVRVCFCCHYNFYCLFLWFIALLCSSDVKLRIYRLEWIPTLHLHVWIFNNKLHQTDQLPLKPLNTIKDYKICRWKLG
jgi:hypothetical protein